MSADPAILSCQRWLIESHPGESEPAGATASVGWHDPPVANHVIVVGSLNLDLTIGLDRAPDSGETVLGNSLARSAGGKGLNQTIAAARIGAEVRMVGAVGDDEAGTWLRTVAQDAGVDISGVAVVPDTPSGTAMILVEPFGDNRIVVVSGANEAVTEEWVRTQIAAAPEVDVVLVQGEIPMDAITAAMRAGRERGATTILNPAPVREYPDDLLRLVDILIPNEHEARALTGIETSRTVDAIEAAVALCDRGAGTTVVTRGVRGSVWASGNKSGTVATYTVHAIDTVAAGDAFCGALAAAIANGEVIGEALAWASAAGALATTTRGAVPSLPTREDVYNMLHAE